MGNLQQEWTSGGVIVTFYEESWSRSERIRATNSKTRPRSCGYDRRAELLAYARHLRSVKAYQENTSTHVRKRRRLWVRLKAIKLSIRRIFGGEKGWRYEPIESQGCECKQQSSSSLRQGKCKWSSISKRLRIALKQFSCSCKCAKGFGETEEPKDLHTLHNP